MARDDGLVYSTETGRHCPDCGRPMDACACRRGSSRRGRGAGSRPGSPRDGVVRVGRETKGRKGKGVTIVTGVPLGGDELATLAKDLKRLCGSGGTVRDDVIEIQGDHRDRIVPALEARGWTVKRSGG